MTTLRPAAVEKAREQRGEIRCRELIGAGESRIGAHAHGGGAAAEALAQESSSSALRVAEPPGERRDAPALAQPGLRGELLRDRQHRLADLRKKLHVLMPVDEIGRAAEGRAKAANWALDLGRQHAADEATEHACAACRERQEGAVARGSKPWLSGRNGAVSAKCSPIAARRSSR